ncbi:YlbF/YmcA family competence regulator [Streptococcus merionis]|uniref:YlbF/YmcA family competence regulator n=1 Tax=Streptococcus merionis TaxID=400065 RepID=UPI0026EA223D|nr:YlbF/YmcA family competence regulator [Streptococcus merionis]
MQENIYDLANGLERALRQLPEYKAVADAKAQIDADQAASDLFKEYTAFQGELQGLMQTGQAPGQDLQERMQAMSAQLQENPVVAEYFTKQQQLSVYLADIERIIFSPLQDLL